MMVIYLILGAVAVFVLTILVRALLFKPEEMPKAVTDMVNIDKDKTVEDMRAVIRCKTVSYRDEALVDRKEFAKLEEEIKERFPNVFANMSFEHVGKTGFLFFKEGKHHDKPKVLMAHYDVVPADPEGWIKPPFEAVLEDGVIWGRGTMDTKGTFISVLEAAEALFKEGFVPENDLYFSFSGEEEIDGDSCPNIVKVLEEKGVKPALVLDEGGAVVENTFPGVKKESAMVGIAEKGSVNMDFVIECAGGHASTPPVHTNMGRLARAVTRIEAKPFKRQLTKPVKEMFNVMGRHSTFGYKIIFANLWCFLPLLDLICKISGGELNAMMRSTVAVTRSHGSQAYNVLPAKADFGINLRLLGKDTIESATEYLNKVIDDKDIHIKLVGGMNPSIASDTDCEEWEYLKTVIHNTWPEAVVSPYLMMACSDSRHYCRITDRVYRFSPMKMSKEERAMIHGINERIPVETLIKTVEFYVRFMRGL